MPSSVCTAVRQRLAVLGLLAAAALTLAACGGSDSTSTVTSLPTGSTTSSTTSSSTSTTTSSTTSSTSTDTATTSDIQQTFDESVRKALIHAGFTLSQADCVIDKLHESLSEADIQAAASGHLPDSVSKAAFNAGAQCGGE